MFQLTFTRAWTMGAALLTCFGCVVAPEASDDGQLGSTATAEAIGDQPAPTVVPVANEEALLAGNKIPLQPDLGAAQVIAQPNDEMLRVLTPCGDEFCTPEAPRCVRGNNGKPTCAP